ncbi:MAG: TonB-dependent receptor [Bacillota bacterium]|nr:TonB-dependent receptor [Bacillota bacterium]
MKRSSFRCYQPFFVGVLLMVTTAIAVGQTISGTITGTVRDSSGAVVPDATITVTNSAQNIVVFSAKTNSTGEYTAPFVPVGTYTVSAEAPGFKKADHSNLKLNVNQNLTVDIVLEPGSTQQTVNVSASALQVDLQSAQAQTVISGTQIRELPLTTRNYEQLVALMPGVSTGLASDQLYVGASNPVGTSNQINFSINGSRPTQNTWNIDGADNVDRGANLTLLAYPSVDSIAEFSVQRSNYNAEFGRSSSGQINVITNAGTNQFHGDVYEFFRNNVLNANTYLNNRKHIAIPPLRYNDFGGTIGGPIWRDKTFFFFSEEARRVITYTNFLANVPSVAELRGDLSASSTPVCVQWSAPGGTCVQQGFQVTNISPAAQAYIKDIFSKLPQPDNPNCTGGCTLTSIGRNIFNFHQEIVRIDQVFSPNFRIFGRFENDTIPTTEPGGLFIGSALPGVATSSTNSPGRIFIIHATNTISPTLINDAGYNYSHGGILSSPVGLTAGKNSPDILSAIKLPYASSLNVAPVLGYTYFSSISDRGQYRDFNDNNNLFDHLAKIVGRHSMKFGVTYNWYQKDENSASGNQGNFGFPTQAPNGTNSEYQEWANFLTGNASSFGQASKDFRAVIRQQQWEIYAQDTYQVKSNLTLSYGLRYSLFRQPTDANNHLTNFDPATFSSAGAPPIDPYTGKLAGTGTPLNGIIIGGNGSPFGSTINNQNTLDVAPRFGLAWDPTGKGMTSVRAGYGMFFDSSAVSRYEINVFTNPPFVNSLSLGPTSLDNPGGTALVSSYPSPLAAVSTNWHIPYAQEWSLDVQHQLPSQWLFDVGYYGAVGRHLLGEIDLNQPLPGAYVTALAPYGVTGPPTRGKTTQQLNYIRPYKGYDAINTQITEYMSNYNGLQVALQKRFSASSQLNLNYTWSKAMTNAFNDTSPAQNTYNLAAEYGPARYDRTHIFNANFVYDLPFFQSQSGFAGHTLGGWGFTGIGYVYSGLPYTVTGVLNDPAGQGVLDGNSAASGRPDLVGNPNKASANGVRIHNNNGIQPWFNTSAYAQVCPTVGGVTTCPTGARPGNSHPGSVRGPGLWRGDLALHKNTKITESVNLQFRAEASNVFNHTNPDGISTSYTSSLFGKVTSYRDPRILQLALKLNF